MKYFFNRFVLFSVLFLFIKPVQAQKIKYSSDFKKAIRYARDYMRIEEYHHAVDVLLEVKEEGKEVEDWNYLMGYNYIYSQTLNKSHALPYLQKVTDYESYEDIYRLMAVSLQYNHKFQEAYDYYDKYLEFLDYSDRDINKEINQLKKQCLTSIDLMEDSLEMLIVNLGPNINTEYQELAPVLSADEQMMIFTARRPDSRGKDIDPIDGLYYEDVYISLRDEEGNWSKATSIGNSVNTIGHDAAVGLSPSGNTLFLYRSDRGHTGNIFFSEWNGKLWTSPEKLPKGINSDNWETHASLTADGQSLYFTSNRSGKGALGEKDIYVIHKDKYGEWGDPENLGDHINTEYDEESPFVHPNGNILYFSSKGHEGMGGYDIYYSERNEKTGEWSVAKNIGYPINTAGDDIFYSISSDGERGYFSSIREDSYGGQDIYMAMIPSQTINLIALTGEVRDETSNNLIEATIEVVDNTTGEVLQSVVAEGGKYLVYLEPELNYGIRFTQEGYLFHSKNIHIQGQEQYIEMNETVQLQRVEEQNREKLNNIFFASKTLLDNSSSSELKALANFTKTTGEYKVGIYVHSAKVEEDSTVNVYETQMRADLIADQLLKLGVAEDKIEAKGLGWQFPVASNQSSLGRQKNNRIEYIILPVEKEVIVYEETVVEDTIPQLTPHLGEVLEVVGTITFASNSNAITFESYIVVEQIYDVMDRYPNLVIEIGGHTDNIGTSSFNYILGEKRAKIIVQQLVILGIEKERMKFRSYGFDEPIADNATAEGRKKNRRISFTPLEYKNFK
ncbi:OmpA family protein [Flammeovirga agarivorans]|uniref:OmpA family protein n=1 Tax=Flammeovirga agarivorans TaxID=2726742 RepID=A0A7X8SG10_9BACT|nr:OmpA family protein [Flammeovirga agarivorans]NLR89571.1 OmpA family protein [Flammeovirga agarivorans]